MSDLQEYAGPETDLSKFLRSAKEAYLSGSHASSGAAQNGPKSVIVMGNEAGDLDSAACAIAYAYFSSLLAEDETHYVPLITVERHDLALRRENQLAYQTCRIDPSELICLDELDSAHSKSPLTCALVDHNRLSTRFANMDPAPKVTAVIDHHVDEERYKDANPRTIVPPTEAGSCASLVALHFKSLLSDSQIASLPAELATLLLSAILIDTHNLSPSIGKAKSADLGAVGWLLPLSTFQHQPAPEVHTPASETSQQLEEENYPSMDPFVPSFPDMESFHAALAHAKDDVRSLSTRDLLRRDYKEYVHPSKDNGKAWEVGLTSVPWRLDEWAARDARKGPGTNAFIDAHQAFCEERGVDLLGSLCAFVDPERKSADDGEGDNNGFRRQLLLYAPAHASQKAKEVARLLEEDKKEELALRRSDDVKLPTPAGDSQGKAQGEPFVVVWEQKDLKATRKQVAPAFKDVCGRVPAP